MGKLQIFNGRNKPKEEGLNVQGFITMKNGRGWDLKKIKVPIFLKVQILATISSQ
jgi:hypothetical protein